MEIMLDFKRITSVTELQFTNLYNLYTLAFQPHERRNWAGLEYELMYEKRFFANVLLQDDKFVGLFNYWTFENFSYIEHLAIVPQMRNQNIGTKAMGIYMGQTKLPIILEVEMPKNPDAIRRIHFYEKLGFQVLSHAYAQPPYEGTDFPVPMLLLSNNIHFANTHYDLIKEKLYKNVYHYEYESERKQVED